MRFFEPEIALRRADTAVAEEKKRVKLFIWGEFSIIKKLNYRGIS